MNVSFLMKLNSFKSAANQSSKLSMHPMWLSNAKPNIKIRQKGCPRTSRFCDKIQNVHGLSIGCEPTGESLSGIATPKVDHMYREGAEDTIDGTVEGDMFDRKLTIKYPFSSYKCSACWDFMECPEKLVEHTSAKTQGRLHRVLLGQLQQVEPKTEGHSHSLWSMHHRPIWARKTGWSW